jgi:DNA-directed RNA polymerase sigma subunit (sigma70/sigma32)
MSRLAVLSELEREVVALRYGLEGRPRLGLAAVARKVGVDVERVRELEIRALKLLAAGAFSPRSA